MTFTSDSSFAPFQSGAVQSVTEITHSIKLLLENGFSFIAVRGEVSNIRKPYSGHLYFTLKDESAQLKGVFFKAQQRYLAKEFGNGDKIICRGRISLYEPRGEYQIIVDSVEFAGEGDLQLAFEQLKRKLDGEGLFASEHKKNLPFLPNSIALITSPSGAAIHDFLTIAHSRFPSIPIEIYPVRVQGEEAAPEISSAVFDANKRKTSDVIVICRGGGSIEDLWPFNDERLARSVYQSALPVVSAIGHEIDFTILDFVADLRAPTPSAAAEAVVPSRDDLRASIEQMRQQLVVAMDHYVKEYRYAVSLQERLLKDPTALLQNLRLRIDQLQISLMQFVKDLCTNRSQQLKALVRTLEANSPQYTITGKKNRLILLQKSIINSFQHITHLNLAKTNNAISLLSAVNPKAVLLRGYSIVYTGPGKQIVRSSSQVVPGDSLRIVTGAGTINSQVTETD
jgi:exodeoxyribonuclease VII large subunit